MGGSSSSSSVTVEPRRAGAEEEEDWAIAEARQRLTRRRSPAEVNDPEAWISRTAERLREEYPNGRAKARGLTAVPCQNPECVNGWLESDEGALPCPECRSQAAS